MDYYYNDDEHDEDDLPEVSLPMSHYTKQLSDDDDDDEQDHYHSNKSLDNWKNLYQTSVQSLQSDEDDQRSIPPKPFYLERQPSIEQPPDERFDSPISEPEIDSNTNKSKWEIRLPELLNSMVGPDRQKREVSRRHTTNIVFQQSPESRSPYSLETDANQPISPLVKQLKQKFDRMTTTNNNNSIPNDTKNHFHIPNYQRFGSLTRRGLTAERKVQKSRPALPIRPTPEITPVRGRSGSIGSENNRPTTTINRNHREKPGPPVSYPKHYYPPPSTTSVVKQLLGGGGTLVYDSITQKSSAKTPKPLIKHQRSLEQTRVDLKNTNTVLTGRQLKPDQAKIKKNPNESLKSDENYYEPMLDQTSIYHSPTSRSIVSSSNHRRNHSNASEREPYYPVYEKNIRE